jgi:uncharacterized protein
MMTQVVLGGVLLGLAAGILLLVRGRILGCSGMVFRTIGISFSSIDSDSLCFLLGLVLCGLGFFFFGSIPNPNHIFASSGWLFFIGGLLTGAGTYIGNGCTSGHGLCGMALVRKRSIVAVCIFFPVAIVTSWLAH